jgi:hypothetical protein
MNRSQNVNIDRDDALVKPERDNPAATVRRSDPPDAHRAAATGQPIPALTNAEANVLLDEEDADRANRLARHLPQPDK